MNKGEEVEGFIPIAPGPIDSCRGRGKRHSMGRPRTPGNSVVRLIILPAVEKNKSGRDGLNIQSIHIPAPTVSK